MSTDDLIAMTQAYVDASNDHDVERIRSMLVYDATYHSSGVGNHHGAGAIIAMNKSFFAASPDVHWQPENFRLVDSEGDGGGVEFDFVITIAGQPSKGVERVFFNDGGKIHRVEVER